MSSVVVFTDRADFEGAWRAALGVHGLEVRTASPGTLAEQAAATQPVVIDTAWSGYDEDELLAAVGFARALGAITAAHVGQGASGIAEVLEELCDGLVARNDGDVARIAAALARRCDSARADRFEYLTVAPRGAELLAILGDGRALLLDRPAAPEDDGAEVAGIELADDAFTAVVSLASGQRFTLVARTVGTRTAPAATAIHVEIDGVRLGKRLRKLRQEAGLTQAELARRTGIHRPNIARVEAGRHTPSLETLARIAQAIGVPTTRVLSGD